MTTKTRTQRSWTDDEISLVLSNKGTALRTLAEELGRSIQSVKHMSSKLANGRPPVALKAGPSVGGTTRYWTDEELALVTDRADLTAREIADMTSRTTEAVARKMRLVRAGIEAPNPGWTPDEDSIVRQWTGLRSSTQIAGMLPGRTPVAVGLRRRRLGLDHAPRGDVYSPHKPGARHLLAKTCPMCGLLMPGERFYVRSGRDNKRSHCNYCESDSARTWQEGNPQKVKTNHASERARESAKKWTDRINDLTGMSATRGGYPYLDEDFKVLEDPSISLLGKALRLKRTYVAVQKACMNRKLPSLGPFTTSRADSAWIIDNPNADRVDEITAALKQEFTTAGIPFPEWDWDD